MNGAKKTWKQVDGVLLLDKAWGMSSNDALQKARRLFSAAKGGHTGTLDPLASGLLPLCFGEATKFSADLLDADKTYETTLQLGITTDTGDAEGEVTGRATVNVSAADIAPVLARFTGPIEQIPPMYSALKRDGRPLYELARAGQSVDRAPRPVTIHAIDCLGFTGDTLTLRVRCSKGTYIRVLGEDIGRALGCGAHLRDLRRTAVGDLTLAGAVSLAELAGLDEADRPARLQPVDALLSRLPAWTLDEAEVTRFTHGNPVAAPTADPAPAGQWRVYAGGRLLGLGEVRPEGRLWPKRLVQLAG